MSHPTRTNQIALGTFGPPPFRIPVRLAVPDLTSHLAITGATNSGKSRLLAHIALSLITHGEGVTLLDPHGDAVRLVLAHLVHRGVYDDPHAFARITYLDLPAAARVWRYAPLNILDQPFDAPTTARLVLEALQRAWPALGDGVAPAFENAVLAGTSVLIRHKLPLTLLHDLLTDAAWRAMLLADEPDATVRGFFARLDGWGSRERAQYLESTLRRAFRLAFSPVLRYSLGQAENRLGSFRGRMDRGESLLVNLALPDPDARRLLGAFLTVSMEQGALQRADTPAGERGRGHTLLIDEAASVIARSGTALAHILEQCRKFGLGLILAGQSEAQYPEGVRAALGGVGTQIVLRLGRADAEADRRRGPAGGQARCRRRGAPALRAPGRAVGGVGGDDPAPQVPAAARRADGPIPRILDADGTARGETARAGPARSGGGPGGAGGGGGAVPDGAVRGAPGDRGGTRRPATGGDGDADAAAGAAGDAVGR